jgi:hypothetical protein
MMIDEEVYDSLEHHGVKGQKWGIRHPKAKKGLKIAGVAGGAVGAAALGAFLATRGTVPVSQLRMKEAELARVRHFVQKAAHQNPVRLNAANEVRKFVQTL